MSLGNLRANEESGNNPLQGRSTGQHFQDFYFSFRSF